MSEEHKRKIGLANSIALKGNKRSEETKRKIGLAFKWKKHPAWKGKNASYYAIHIWVNRWKGTPNTCEQCGKTGLKRQQIHWANIDHKYRRVLDDYIRLCAKCHGEFDKSDGKRKHQLQ